VKLGYSAPAWGAGPPADAFDAVLEADRLGLDSVWTSETYGADAFTPLAWWGSRTTRVRLGTAIAQLSARPPTTTAMSALALDHLSGGRLLLGLGASGPQVVEGWYGQPFARPLERTREYVTVIRQAIRRDQPVRLAGRHYTIPLDGGTGLGRALKPIVHPVRADLPVLLAAEGPKNIALAAEIADGWLPMWFSPKSDAWAREQLATGFAAREPTLSAVGAFETIAPVYARVDDDIEAAADPLRPIIALYIGGMGARGANFHLEVFARLGWDAECEKIQDLYLDGRKDEAIAAVPTALVEDVALIGPLAKIREELTAWRATTLTTMAVKCAPEVLAQLRDDFD
jgi:F420-dependent oxidoreductase-like protein